MGQRLKGKTHEARERVEGALEERAPWGEECGCPEWAVKEQIEEMQKPDGEAGGHVFAMLKRDYWDFQLGPDGWPVR